MSLCDLTQTQFVNLIWPGLLKYLKEVDSRWDARTVLEASSATTQCQNTVGRCIPKNCKCWICGELVYLDSQGNEVSESDEVDSKLVPNCEHKLPIVQAFVILGGLFWARQPPKTDSIIRKNYAWSHAVCNIQKSDHIYFDDDSIKVSKIQELLNTLWGHKSFDPIKQRILRSGSTKNQWITKQTVSMVKDIQPLFNYYKRGNQEGQSLNLLSGVSIPLSFFNELVQSLPQDSRLRQALLEYKPEHIQTLQTNQVLQEEGRQQRRLNITPEQIDQVKRICVDKNISDLFSTFITEKLKKMGPKMAVRSPQHNDKLQFLSTLMGISNGIENKCDSSLGSYWETTDINITLRDISDDIEKYQCQFFNQVIPQSDIADIIRDVNLNSPNPNQKLAYVIELVQTLFIYFLYTGTAKFLAEPPSPFLKEVLLEVESFQNNVKNLLESQIQILFTKPIYADEKEQRYFTYFLLSKYTNGKFMTEINKIFPQGSDINNLLGNNIPPQGWLPSNHVRATAQALDQTAIEKKKYIKDISPKLPVFDKSAFDSAKEFDAYLSNMYDEILTFKNPYEVMTQLESVQFTPKYLRALDIHWQEEYQIIKKERDERLADLMTARSEEGTGGILQPSLVYTVEQNYYDNRLKSISTLIFFIRKQWEKRYKKGGRKTRRRGGSLKKKKTVRNVKKGKHYQRDAQKANKK